MSEIRLETKQSQKLSQGMQTAIHLLSLDLAGLSDYMLKAVAERHPIASSSLTPHNNPYLPVLITVTCADGSMRLLFTALMAPAISTPSPLSLR